MKKPYQQLPQRVDGLPLSLEI